MSTEDTAPTLRIALDRLRTDHASLARDLESGNRAFWIGSGISLGQVPGLETILGSVLKFLQSHIVPGKVNDPHLASLRQIVARKLPAEIESFDANPETWCVPSDLSALTNSYSEILGTDVEGMPADYLLWEGADVRESYGAPELLPGPDHFLIAILIQEGVLTEMASANWDGLVEKAVALLTPSGGPSPLAVYVTNESFRDESGPAKLLKLHGCAVKARDASGSSRDYLIALPGQISNIMSLDRHREMRDEVTKLAQRRMPLFLGLSVQDADLLTFFTLAGARSPWPWNQDHPAYVFAERELGQTHRTLLQQVYVADFQKQSTAIRHYSTFPMFSRPLLAALVVHVIGRKLSALIAFGRVDSVNHDRLREGLSVLEGRLAEGVGSDLERLVDNLTLGYARLVWWYFGNGGVTSAAGYLSLAPGTVQQISTDPRTRHSNSPELATVLGLLGMGDALGLWATTFECDDPTTVGLVTIKSSSTQRNQIVAIVRDEAAADNFMASDAWTLATVPTSVIHANNRRPARVPRSPRRGVSQDRNPAALHREGWMSELVDLDSDPDTLFEAFREEMSL